jgi:RNA polymerase sigma-70 factor (ECF subfamily)
MKQTKMPASDARDAQPADDLTLVARAREGDAQAFRVIMERHNRRLYRVARSMMQDESEAEDVVQEAYLHAFAALAGFRGESSLSTWLTRITVNEALARKRRRRPTVALETVETLQESTAQIIDFPTMTTSDPERSAAQHEIRRLLELAIDKLPEPFRLVFVMRDVEDLSIEETATLLGIRPETVKTRLHRARRMLRETLDQRLAASLKGTFPFAGVRCERITQAVLVRLPQRKD